MIGTFDGRSFVQESIVLCSHFGPNFYAAQTWSGVSKEDGRLIQTGWSRLNLPDMPFNGYLTVPCDLSLKTTKDGIKLCYHPVDEIKKLYIKKHSYKNVDLNEGKIIQTGIEAELLDIHAEIDVGLSKEINIIVNGVQITHSLTKKKLICREVSTSFGQMDGKVSIRIIIDRTTATIFGNGGVVYMPIGILCNDVLHSLDVFARGGRAKLVYMDIYEMKSCW